MTTQPPAPKAPTAPTAAPSATGAPGAKAEGAESKDGKKARAKLVDYIEWKRSQDGVAEDYLIDSNEVPEDFKSSVHNPLKKSHFKEEWQYLEMKAGKLEAQAANLRKEAEIAKTIGSKEDQKKMSKVLKMQQELAALTASLEEGGFDMSLLEQGGDSDES